MEAPATGLGMVYAQATDNSNQNSASVGAQLSVASPSITEAVTHNGGASVTLSGTVTGGSVAGLTVTFGGEITGSTTTDANGNYTFTGNAAGAGSISVQTSDVWSQPSNTATGTLTSTAPTITFTVSQAGEHNVTISGQVNDQSPGGLTVTFSGVVSGTTTTSSSGAFTFNGTATALGTVDAEVTDAAGATGSGSAQLTDTAPSISNFVSYYSSGAYYFSGTVNAPYAPGLTVTLTNVPGVGTVTVTVGDDDTFTDMIATAQVTNVTVTATVTDWWGETSQPVTVTI